MSLETWVEETSKPQSSPMTVVTRLVLTPWRYMLEMAALRARSLRLPFSRREVRNGMSLPRTWGVERLSPPIEVWKLRGLKPLAWPLRASTRSYGPAPMCLARSMSMAAFMSSSAILGSPSPRPS